MRKFFTCTNKFDSSGTNQKNFEFQRISEKFEIFESDIHRERKREISFRVRVIDDKKKREKRKKERKVKWKDKKKRGVKIWREERQG